MLSCVFLARFSDFWSLTWVRRVESEPHRSLSVSFSLLFYRSTTETAPVLRIRINLKIFFSLSTIAEFRVRLGGGDGSGAKDGAESLAPPREWGGTFRNYDQIRKILC